MWDVIKAYCYPFKPDCDSHPAKSREVCITRDELELRQDLSIWSMPNQPILSLFQSPDIALLLQQLLLNFKAKFKGALAWRPLHILWGLIPVPRFGAGRGGKGWTSNGWVPAGLTSWQTQGQEIWGYPANFPLTFLFKYWYIFPFSTRH